jgi:condensin complex subunit 3
VAEIPDEGPDTTLRRAICSVFADAQKSTAAHRKAIISLRKIQEACCYEPTNTKKGKQDEDFDEDEFNTEILRCAFRILPIKKSEAVGDRIVRFLGSFLETATAKDNEIFQDDEDVPETPSSRLVTAVLSAMIPLMMAKDKVVRFRATQITSHLINTLSTLDLSLFQQLKVALLKRIHDKEAQVRMHAIYGLTRFAADPENDDEDNESDSDEDAGSGILEKLILVLQNDPSAEVRRNLLLNLPLTKELLPYLFERARDADVTTRKALFARLLPAMGDFRSFSLTFRDKLLRWGLRDRDENVRKAMARIFRERWIEDCAARPANRTSDEPEDDEPKDPNMAAVPSMNALSELLERIDVVNTGGEGGIALLAMQEFWEGRPDYVDYVSFPDEFWGDLSPEVAFVARTFNDFCRSKHRDDRYVGSRSLDILVEEKLPEVTKFGFLLQGELNRLMEAARAAAMGEDEDSEEELASREFVVEQMLHMALTFDYSDEVGRRKMDILMRDALAMPDLPEETTRLVIENLRRVCGEDSNGEREFCRLVVEAIAEVHDTIMGEDDNPAQDDSSIDGSFHSATSQLDGAGDETLLLAKKRLQRAGKTVESSKETDTEQAIRELMVNLKCLHIALCLLQNIQCDVHQYEHLVMTLNSLIVPAVRSQEAPIRERGLFCLGLCCLLSKVCATPLHFSGEIMLIDHRNSLRRT